MGGDSAAMSVRYSALLHPKAAALHRRGIAKTAKTVVSMTTAMRARRDARRLERHDLYMRGLGR